MRTVKKSPEIMLKQEINRECDDQQQCSVGSQTELGTDEVGFVSARMEDEKHEQRGQQTCDKPPTSIQPNDVHPLTKVHSAEKAACGATVLVTTECNTDGSVTNGDHRTGEKPAKRLQFEIGDVVQLTGLRRAEYNNRKGTVVSCAGEKEERLSVQLMDTKKLLSVQKGNLQRLSTTKNNMHSCDHNMDMVMETPAGRFQDEYNDSKINEYICAQVQQNLNAEHAKRKTWGSVLLPEDIGLLAGEMFECMQIHQVHEGDNKSIAETRSQARKKKKKLDMSNERNSERNTSEHIYMATSECTRKHAQSHTKDANVDDGAHGCW
jgi:hypothetical protein